VEGRAPKPVPAFYPSSRLILCIPQILPNASPFSNSRFAARTRKKSLTYRGHGQHTTFNIRARYPDFKNRFHKTATREFTAHYIGKIKEFRQWLLQRIIN